MCSRGRVSGSKKCSVNLDAHPRLKPLTKLVNLVVGQCDTAVRPVVGSVYGAIPFADAMNPKVAAEWSILRGDVVPFNSIDNSLPYLKRNAIFRQSQIGGFTIRIAKPKKTIKTAIRFNPADMKGTDRRLIAALHSLLAGTITPDRDIVQKQPDVIILHHF